MTPEVSEMACRGNTYLSKYIYNVYTYIYIVVPDQIRCEAPGHPGDGAHVNDVGAFTRDGPQSSCPMDYWIFILFGTCCFRGSPFTSCRMW
jgi:hypothetical protein